MGGEVFAGDAESHEGFFLRRRGLSTGKWRECWGAEYNEVT